MNYRVILFDVDGLVVTSEALSARLEKEYGASREDMKPFFQGVFTQCKVGEADLKIELKKVLSIWKWPGSVDDLLAYWFQGTNMNQEIVEITKRLRKEHIKCYLATNQTSYRSDYLFNELGLGLIFDGIYHSAELGCLKDDPEFFRKILQDQKMEGDQVLFIDHDEKNLLAAKSVGVATFRYTDISSLKSFLQNSLYV